MKTASRKIRVAVTALCTVFALCSFAVAAGAVDITRNCSLEVKVGDTITAEQKPNVDITANLYKVADFDGTTYTYTAVDGFDTALSGYKDFNDTQLKDASTAAAATVQERAATTDATVTFGAGATGKMENLACGLYLLTATAVDNTGTNNYTFSPVLLSLPSMDNSGNDIYDISGVELKFSSESAKTSINIQKDLTRYSELQGPATFIFQVEAVKDGKSVYSNVISMVFSAAGSQVVTIPNLPVGAIVTVTEVYGGGSYTIQGENVKVLEALKPNEVPTAAFINDYNGNSRNSHSVTNRFTPSTQGGTTTWTHTPFADTTPDVQ